MKAGTTTLSEWLRHHPELFLCRPKEPQFFSRAEAAGRGWAWYGSLFSEAGPGQLVGEASTCYSRWPHFGDVPERLAAHMPEAKLIFLMRHPVERAYSHYRHEMQRWIARGKTPLDFDRALEEIPEIIDASLYATQIDHFLAHYPEEQLLLLTTNDLDENPDQVWERIQNFLGISSVPRTTGERANAFGDHLAKRAMEKRLEEAGTSVFFRLARRLAPKALRANVRQALIDPRRSRRLVRKQVEAGRAQLSPLTAATRARLVERFAATTKEIEIRLGQTLPSWHE